MSAPRVVRPFLALLAVGLVVALLPFGAAAGNGETARAEALTNRLVGLGRAYQRAGDAAPSLETLLTVAAERQALLRELVTEDPAAVLRVTLPERVRERLPQAVQALSERPSALAGELEVRYEEYPDGVAHVRHFLRADGQRVALHFSELPTTLRSRPSVQATGVVLPAGDGEEPAMVLPSADSILVLGAGSATDGGTNGGTPDPLPNTLGEQRTAVILVNFRDDPANQPWTVAEVENLVFGEVSGFYAENSYGQTWLAGNVYGWFTIDHDSTVWDLDAIAAKAEAAATASGADLSPYGRFVYVFPKNSGSTLYGAGTVGGSPSRAWFSGRLDLWVVGHEMGHNFGLQHSHALECGAAVVGSGCVSYEYGDHLDIMGNYVAGHFNAFQKAQLGWLGYGNSPAVTTVETGGAFTLAPLETGGTGSAALKILKSVDAVTGEANWYYLEFRQPLGADAFLAGKGNIARGVVFHTGTDSDPRSSYQLDLTPESDSNAYYDWEDAALEAGFSYTDPNSGVTVSTLWTDGSGAQVDVAYGVQSCVRAAPAVASTPAESAWLEPGATAVYAVTVTNHDGSGCAASDFVVTPAAPIGWTVTAAGATQALAPGESGTATLAVTSPAGAADGFYDISVTAEHLASPADSASMVVTYVVSGASGPANQPPVATDDAVLLGQIQPVLIAPLANDYDPDGDPLTLVSVTQGAKGSVTVNGDNTVSYTPGKPFKTGDTFTYGVTDGTATVYATVTIALESSGGGGGNGGGKGGGKPAK